MGLPGWFQKTDAALASQTVSGPVDMTESRIVQSQTLRTQDDYNRKSRVYCLSYYQKLLSHTAVFTSNVQCVRLADDALLKCVVTEVISFAVVAFKTLQFHKVV